MARTNRRKSPIVDAPEQARIVLGISLLPMTVILIAAGAMWFFGDRLFEEAKSSNAELPSLGMLTMIQYVFIVATGALAVLEALRYSNRVVGPAMRICRALKQIREGSPAEPIKLRKGDMLNDVADEVNSLLEHLRRNAPTTTPSAAPTEPNTDQKLEIEVVEYAE